MENIKVILEQFRKKRAFDGKIVLNKKIELLNKFFRNNQLDSAVVGLSGGIDSALVFTLLIEASKAENSPIKKIVGITMPIFSDGTSNQLDALEHANLLKSITSEKDNKGEIITMPLGFVTNEYVKRLENTNISEEPNAWTIGQLASIVRTPNMYFYAAYLQQLGYNSIVVGTTNRDEGSYIGFFGKASDAMVDLQGIADLHKSEVIELAKLLHVPLKIIERTPMGDVWDSRSDEEMIGAPYWFLELFQLMRDYDYVEVDDSNFTEEDAKMWNNWIDNIQKLHAKNRHKYNITDEYVEMLGFARYVDVMQRKVKS